MRHLLLMLAFVAIGNLNLLAQPAGQDLTDASCQRLGAQLEALLADFVYNFSHLRAMERLNESDGFEYFKGHESYIQLEGAMASRFAIPWYDNGDLAFFEATYSDSTNYEDIIEMLNRCLPEQYHFYHSFQGGDSYHSAKWYVNDLDNTLPAIYDSLLIELRVNVFDEPQGLTQLSIGYPYDYTFLTETKIAVTDQEGSLQSKQDFCSTLRQIVNDYPNRFGNVTRLVGESDLFSDGRLWTSYEPLVVFAHTQETSIFATPGNIPYHNAYFCQSCNEEQANDIYHWITDNIAACDLSPYSFDATLDVFEPTDSFNDGWGGAMVYSTWKFNDLQDFYPPEYDKLILKASLSIDISDSYRVELFIGEQ